MRSVHASDKPHIAETRFLQYHRSGWDNSSVEDEVVKQLVQVQVLPGEEKEDEDEVYDEERRPKWARELDEKLPRIAAWLKGDLRLPPGMTSSQASKWVRDCSHFFEEDGRLHRRQAGHPQLVVFKDEQSRRRKGAPFSPRQAIYLIAFKHTRSRVEL